MSYAIKITGYSKTNHRMLMDVEPDWWNAEELVQDSRFIECIKRRFYRNYEADLSLEEVRDLHERYKNNVNTVQKFLCSKLRRASSPCQKLHGVLFRAFDNYSHFRVEIFEQELGL